MNKTVAIAALLAACSRSTAPSSPSVSGGSSARGPFSIVFGGTKDITADLVDLQATRDGRVLMLACVRQKDFSGLALLRFDHRGGLEARSDFERSCEHAYVVEAKNGDVLVLDDVCGGSRPGGEGCARLRRLDASFRELWSERLPFSVVTAIALRSDDALAIAGWRARPDGGQDPTETGIDVFDTNAAAALLEQHSIVGRRIDVHDIELFGTDIFTTGIVDDLKTIDGRSVTVPRSEVMLLARLGATPWTFTFDTVDVQLYNHPRLAMLPPDVAVVGISRERNRQRVFPEVQFTQRFDVATGKPLARAEQPANGLSEGVTDVIVAGDAAFLTKPVERKAEERSNQCKPKERCRFHGGPAAYGKTLVPHVHRIDPQTLATGTALTKLSGIGITRDAKLAFAPSMRALYIGGTVTGTIELPGRTFATMEIRRAPCDHGDDTSSVAKPRFILANQPPDPPCLVHIQQMSGVFVTRVN